MIVLCPFKTSSFDYQKKIAKFSFEKFVELVSRTELIAWRTNYFDKSSLTLSLPILIEFQNLQIFNFADETLISANYGGKLLAIKVSNLVLKFIGVNYLTIWLWNY